MTAVAKDVGDWTRELMLFCPGCKHVHVVHYEGENHWDWNGSLESPTLSPSILVYPSLIQPRCHSFVRDGVWEFLSDCDHALAGQRVPLLPVTEWEHA